MGYTLRIGELDASDDWLTVYSVEADCPLWPGGEEIPGRRNRLSPSYSVWAASMASAGLESWWRAYTSDEIVYAITPTDAATVRAALAAYLAAHPGCTPGWCEGSPECDAAYSERERARTRTTICPLCRRDATAARLYWLDYWLHWALATCQRPTLYVG